MRKLMMILLFITISLLCSGQRVETRMTGFKDTDNSSVYTYDIGYFHKINKKLTIGSKVGTYNNIQTQNLLLKYVEANAYVVNLFDSIFSADVNLNYVFDKYDMFRYDLLFNIKPNKFIYIEIFNSKDFIGTTKSILEKEVIYNNGVSTDFNFLKGKLTFVGAYTNQYFTDNNSRGIKVFKIIGMPTKKLGLVASSKISDLDFYSPDYFSPIDYDIYSGGMFYTFNIKNKFILKPKIHYGIQYINKTQSNYFSFDIKFKGWYNDRYGVDLNIGYSNSKDNFVSYDNNYSYWIIDLKLKYQLK